MTSFWIRRRERGAALVEMAIVLPLLVVLFVGMAEFGFAFKQKLLIANAVQTATRTGSTLGTTETADKAILDSIQQGFSALPSSGDFLVEKVTVYLADSSGNPDSTMINSYSFTPGVSGCDWTPCPTTEANIGGPWLPSLRNVDVGSLDHVGVTIFYGHDWVIGGYGFLPALPCNSDGSQCWTETSVMRLEPVG